MTIREQYGLEFYKQENSNFSTSYFCRQFSFTNENNCISTLLNTLNNREDVALLEEIKNAITGLRYEEFYRVDGASFNDNVQILSPNAIINQAYQIPLDKLKAILEEWVLFCKH